MKTLNLYGPEWEIDFDRAKALADANAQTLLGESTCLSWYDRDRDFESPANASDCHEACEIPGYIEYAENRGAELKLDVNKGAFIFCYRSLADFVE